MGKNDPLADEVIQEASNEASPDMKSKTRSKATPLVIVTTMDEQERRASLNKVGIDVIKVDE